MLAPSRRVRIVVLVPYQEAAIHVHALMDTLEQSVKTESPVVPVAGVERAHVLMAVCITLAITTITAEMDFIVTAVLLDLASETATMEDTRKCSAALNKKTKKNKNI